jgi:Mg2+ and Co2+ transporter CorA
MKILAKIDNSLDAYILMHVIDKEVHRAIHNLINLGEHNRAIEEAILNADTMRDVSMGEIAEVEADLILTRENSHRDLTSWKE